MDCRVAERLIRPRFALCASVANPPSERSGRKVVGLSPRLRVSSAFSVCSPPALKDSNEERNWYSASYFIRFSLVFKTQAPDFKGSFGRKQTVGALFSAFPPPFLRSFVKPRMVTPRIVSLAFLLTLSTTVFDSHFLVTETHAADTPAGPLDQHTLDKRIGSVLKDLKLGDPALETKVRAVLEPHFQ